MYKRSKWDKMGSQFPSLRQAKENSPLRFLVFLLFQDTHTHPFFFKSPNYLALLHFIQRLPRRLVLIQIKDLRVKAHLVKFYKTLQLSHNISKVSAFSWKGRNITNSKEPRWWNTHSLTFQISRMLSGNPPPLFTINTYKGSLKKHGKTITYYC